MKTAPKYVFICYFVSIRVHSWLKTKTADYLVTVRLRRRQM
jgi:hypothetical protein